MIRLVEDQVVSVIIHLVSNVRPRLAHFLTTTVAFTEVDTKSREQR